VIVFRLFSRRLKDEINRLFRAILELGTNHAIIPDLMGQGLLIHRGETQFLKEGNMIGQGEDPTQTQAAGLFKQGLDQFATDPDDDQRSHFGQMAGADPQRAATNNLSLALGHHEIAQMLTDGLTRTRQDRGRAGGLVN
jgi:hypothetical protein